MRSAPHGVEISDVGERLRDLVVGVLEAVGPETRTQSVKSILTDTGVVSNALATLAPTSPNLRPRAATSSSGLNFATPARHRFPCRTRILGLSTMFRPHPERVPC